MNSPLFKSMSAELAKKNKFIIDLQWSLSTQLRGWHSADELETTQIVALILSIFQHNTDVCDHEEMLRYYADLSPRHEDLVEKIILHNPVGTKFWHMAEAVLFESMKSLFPLSKDDFHRLYCEIYKRGVSSNFKKYGSNTSLTQELELLILSLLKETTNKSIYAPYSLSSSLLLAGNYGKVTLESLDEMQSLQHILALGIKGKVKPLELHNLESTNYKGDAELMVSLPPIGLKTQRSRNFKSDGLAIENALEAVLDGGVKQAVIICSPSNLFVGDRNSAELRKKLVESRLLSSVTLLPPDTVYGTGMKLVMICLSSKQFTISESSVDLPSVRFVDASTFIKDGALQVNSLKVVYGSSPIKDISTDASIEDIVEKNYNLSVTGYTTYTPEIVVPVGYKLMTIGELVSIVRNTTNSSDVVTISPQDFPEDFKSTNFSDVIAGKPLREVRNCTKIEKESLLISSMARERFKVAHFVPEGNHIYISRNTYAFESTIDGLSLRWLALEMAQDHFQKQLDSLGLSSLMDAKRLSWSQLKTAKVAVPPLNEQTQNLAADSLENILMGARAKEAGLTEYTDKLRQGYLDSLSVTKHNLVDALSVVKPKVNLLQKMLARDQQLIADGMIGESTTLEYIDSVHLGLIAMGRLIKELGNHELFKKEGSVNIIKCLEQLKVELASEKLQIEIDLNTLYYYSDNDGSIVFFKMFERKDLYVGVEENQFQTMIRQIAQNAVIHGAKPIIRLHFWFSITSEGRISLMCGNDGVEFSPKMTLHKYVTKGETLGQTGQSGTGGYILHQTMQNVKGELRIHNLKHLGGEIPEECSVLEHCERAERFSRSDGFEHLNTAIELIFPPLEL